MHKLIQKKLGYFFRVFLRERSPFLFDLGKTIYGVYRRLIGSYRLKKRLRKRPWRITLGAGGLYDKGWIPTDVYELNITEESEWMRFFEPNSIDAIIAEHLWEHLTPKNAVVSAKNCYKYLKYGGILRVAVPDGYHPDPKYIENVKVGGMGPSADDHKVLYTYKTLSGIFKSVGFNVHLLEYYDENGQFHLEDWDSKNGMIYRSARRNNNGTILLNASIIIDAFKEKYTWDHNSCKHRCNSIPIPPI